MFTKPVDGVLDEVRRGVRPVAHAYYYARFLEEHEGVHYVDRTRAHGFRRFVAEIVSHLFSRLLGWGFQLGKALDAVNLAGASGTLFCTTDSVGLPVLLIKRFFLKNRVIYQSIGLYDAVRNRPLARLLARHLLVAADVILCYTEAERAGLLELTGLSAERVVSTHSVAGFSPEFYKPFPAVNDGYVLTVGRDKHRDFATFIEAARIHGLRSIIIKSGAYPLPANIPPNVWVYLDLEYQRVQELYRSAEIVVLSLHNNTYSAGWVVLGEAMSLGKPVVVTRVAALAGMEDILVDGENCVLVPETDPIALAAAVNRLHADANERTRLGMNARATAERHAERYYTTLKKILLGTPRMKGNTSQ